MEERIAQLEKQVEILWDLLEIITCKSHITNKEWKESVVINDFRRNTEELVEEVNRLERYKETKSEYK